jgi:hypothetical protein
MYGGRTTDEYMNLEESEWMPEGELQNVSVGTDWLRSEIRHRTHRLCCPLDRDIQFFGGDAIPEECTQMCNILFVILGVMLANKSMRERLGY